jgi:16S rRNA pseudouridine516 synthase
MSVKKRIRLDKMLGNMGFGTRSEIKKAVKQGRVAVDGQNVKDSGLQVDPESQTVQWDGEDVRYKDVVYLMLNKPQGVISATEDSRDRTVLDLLEPEDRLLQPFPVGRLDKDTEGLLLLTNDGQLAHELLSPRKHVDKTYEALVRGTVGQEDVSAFGAGVKLDDGYVTMPAELTVLGVDDGHDLPDGYVMMLAELTALGMDDGHDRVEGEAFSRISLTIREGKFHQVKRMFEAVGKKVVFLKRVSMGPLELDSSLQLGEYRELTEQELEALKAHRGRSKSAESNIAGIAVEADPEE